MEKYWHLATTLRDYVECPWKLKYCLTVNGKRLKTTKEVLEFLQEQLAMGHELYPLDESCEGFDYKTGCPGHEIKEAQNVPI